VGRKVADCVCLMGFSRFDVVPIDVHIFNISKKIFGLSYKKLNGMAYREIQGKYKAIFGDYSGIAQLYFFKSSLDKRSMKEEEFKGK
jgi:N-glycosylase/DNA lyase